MTPTQRLSTYARRLLTVAGESYSYDLWDDAFCRKELRRCYETTYGILTLAELQSIPRETLLDYGFGLWDEEKPDLLLIPLWLVPYLDQTMTVTCIDGEEYTLADADNDHRFGCIAYGIHHAAAAD